MRKTYIASSACAPRLVEVLEEIGFALCKSPVSVVFDWQQMPFLNWICILASVKVIGNSSLSRLLAILNIGTDGKFLRYRTNGDSHSSTCVSALLLLHLIPTRNARPISHPPIIESFSLLQFVLHPIPLICPTGRRPTNHSNDLTGTNYPT